MQQRDTQQTSSGSVEGKLREIVRTYLDSLSEQEKRQVRDALQAVLEGKPPPLLPERLAYTAYVLLGELISAGLLVATEDAAKALTWIVGRPVRPRFSARSISNLAQTVARELVKAYVELVRPQASAVDVMTVYLAYEGLKSKDWFEVARSACTLYRLLPERIVSRASIWPRERVDLMCTLVDAVASAQKVTVGGEDGSVYTEYSIAIPLPRDTAEKLLEEVLGEDASLVVLLRARAWGERASGLRDILLLHVSPQAYNLIRQHLARYMHSWAYGLLRYTLALIDWRIARRILRGISFLLLAEGEELQFGEEGGG